MLTPNPAALIVALLPRHCPEDTGLKLAIGIGQIDPPRHRTPDPSPRPRCRHQRTPPTLSDDDATGRGGRRPHHRSTPASISASIRSYSRPPPATPSAHVAVDVTIRNQPTLQLGEALAIGHLPPHPQLVTITVRRNPRVDPHANRTPTDRNRHSGNIAEHSHVRTFLRPTICNPLATERDTTGGHGTSREGSVMGSGAVLTRRTALDGTGRRGC